LLGAALVEVVDHHVIAGLHNKSSGAAGDKDLSFFGIDDNVFLRSKDDVAHVQIEYFAAGVFADAHTLVLQSGYFRGIEEMDVRLACVNEVVCAGLEILLSSDG
jgi:hypothetical protein